MVRAHTRDGLLDLILQGLRFGTIGLIATGIHVGVFIASIEIFQIAPVPANLTAFVFAFVFGFLGHFSWTFRAASPEGRNAWTTALPKFVVVALVGLALNTLVVYVLVDVLQFHYLYAVGVMVTAVPAAVFLLSKYWAFA